MNKIIVVIGIFTIAFIAFTIGYKIGDAHGYNEGYDVGYLYDCRDELKLLNDKAESLGRAVSFTESQVTSLTRANDSLRRPGLYDSMHVRFTRDSLKYHKHSQRLNDSLRKATGSSIRNIVSPDGRINYAACVLDLKLKELPECKDGYRPSWRK